MLCKIISYNLTIVISSMFKLDITPAFFTNIDIREPVPLIGVKKVIN